MIDLSILPARLPVPPTNFGPVTVTRLAAKHQEMLCQAGRVTATSVKPWMGSQLCPVTPVAARQCIEHQEQLRRTGYGITYLLIHEQECLGLGTISHIHALHGTGNLGYWIRTDVTGKGLAVTLCQSLIKLAFAQMGMQRLELFIEPDNQPSLRVAEKLGAMREGLCRKRILGRDAWLYALISQS